jgi:hypothetical protein
MLNLLDGYIQNSLSCEKEFKTNPNLKMKVSENREFRRFEGNTVVFLLDEKTKCLIAKLRDQLYATSSNMLAAKLDHETFHMTLHDLENVGRGEENLSLRMEKIASQAKELLLPLRERKAIRMSGTCMFNMVNTSIVLGLGPVDEESERSLNEMYEAFEKILPLGYALTPHITLAYFYPGIYTAEETAALSKALCPVDIEITMKMENLVLQCFTDMNHYVTLF